MIEIKNVDFFYETAESESSLKNVSVTVPKGQVVLLCGESGSGKTTFGRLINGLIPCYYDGKMDGQVFVNKISTAGIQLHELAETVGSVFQNTKSQFYTLLTDTEIVFACENIGMERSEIFSRFEKTVQDFHMEKLLGKNVSQLSGGEKQKIACACVSMRITKYRLYHHVSSTPFSKFKTTSPYLAISNAPVIRWNASSVTSSGDARSARVILQQPTAMAFAAW